MPSAWRFSKIVRATLHSWHYSYNIRTMDAVQAIVVKLPADIVRRCRAVLALPSPPYATFSEMIVTALENQLALDSSVISGEWSDPSFLPPTLRPDSEIRPSALRRGDAAGARGLRLPADFSTSTLAVRAADGAPGGPLSSFTNRLAPLVVGPRVAALQMVAAQGTPSETLVENAAAEARALGLRLHAEDTATSRRGRERRYVGWPIGDDDQKSLARYTRSFLFRPEGEVGSGPLIDLGLLVIEAGLVYLTHAGVRFALLPIPSIDEPGEMILTEAHQDILASAIAGFPAERKEVAAFLAAVERNNGDQDAVDLELRNDHAAWTDAQVVSHRAAMIGRLRDLGAVDVNAMPAGKSRVVAGPRSTQMRRLLLDQPPLNED